MKNAVDGEGELIPQFHRKGTKPAGPPKVNQTIVGVKMAG